MPFNLLKTYNQLLDIGVMTPEQRITSLRGVFRRDIEDNANFVFKDKQIRPIKKDGQNGMDILFNHLTHVKEEVDGVKKTARDVFENGRSVRLHWIKTHVEERANAEIEIFSYEDRVNNVDRIRTYIYNKTEKYIIILEPQNSGQDYFLITAYYLDQVYGSKQIDNKLKKKLADIH